jgi:hypothetical protein
MARSGLLELLVFLVGFLPHVGYVAIGVWLLLGARPLARRLLLPSAAAGSATLSPAGVEAQAIAFSVVGILLVGQALAGLGLAVAHMLRGAAADASDVGMRWEDAIPGLVGAAAKAGFGVVLFLRAPGLALLWHRIRTGGVLRPQVNDGADASRAEPPA